MAIRVRTPEDYAAALRKLFPRGDYWDRQFADPKSDCSLFCRAKTEEFIRFRGRMSDLQNESVIHTAEETIEEWERVITGSVNTGHGISMRRELLISQKAENVTLRALQEIGLLFGVAITGVELPFRPAFFGFSRFGIDRVSSPAAFSVLFVCSARPEDSVREQFESQVAARLLAQHIIYFVYGGV